MTVVDEVKQRLDIVDIVSQYVQLQKAGRNFKAVCPFHSERTPSFFVSPERQSWHCFGACGTGGDVFSFVMKKENLEFPEALRLLAERAGVPLPERRPGEEAERDRLREANEAAAQFYHRTLLSTEAGKKAGQYLEKRCLDLKTIQDFQLGYSPTGWDGLCQHLRERGFGAEELVAAGLAVEGEWGLRDLFRQRIIFPITDVRGRVVGFGGRSLAIEGQEEAQPKYLNTAQTANFDKGSLLYALDKAKEDIRRQGLAVIVEGYMDAIAAHQHGFSNVVASMGTALGERQVRLLKRFSRDVVLALDADTAGQEATLRAIEYQDILGRDIRVVILPEGRDPDQVIRSDPEAWPTLLAGAQPLLDYKFETVSSALDLSQPQQRSQAVEELLPLLAAIGDTVVQAHYLQRLARLARLGRTGEDALHQMLRRQGRKQRRGREVAAQGQVAAAPSPGSKQEEFCLALLLRYPELQQEGLALSPDLFWHSENRQLLQAWQRCPDLEEMREAVATELEHHLQRIVVMDVPSYQQQEAREALHDCLRRLEQRELEAIAQANIDALAVRETEGGPIGVEELAAAAQPPGSPPEESGSGDISQTAALLRRSMEIGIRLHRSSKMEMDDDEDFADNSPEVEVNG